MCGGCLCCARSCRTLWSVLIILTAVPFTLHCSQSPAAAAAGKIYPRGNHWAVGHLMGKKSAERLPEQQRDPPLPEYFTAPETTRIRGLEQLLEAILQPSVQKQMRQHDTERQVELHSSQRQKDREQRFREMSDLLLLALKPQDRDYSG